MKKVTQDEIVNYCKQYGFIFQGSEIYGGLANTWDYGPLGRELKENIRSNISSSFVREKLKRNKSIRYLTPDEVYYYIKENNLY